MQSSPAQQNAPDTPEDHPWWWLGAKFAIAMTTTDLVSRLLGFPDPTWAVISAAFLVSQPPLDSAKTAMQRIVATIIGIALGLLGAYATVWLGFFPSLHFVLVGFIVGAMASRDASFLYGVVVAVVVSFAAGGEDPIWREAVDVFVLVAVGSLIAPLCVFAMERFRASRRKAPS